MSTSRFRLLTWHFFRRFLDNDLISPNGDAHVGLSQTLAAMLTPGLLVVAAVLFKYGVMWRPTWEKILRSSVADSLLYVSLSMIVLGLAATITWDAFFLDARDRYILAVLPVPDRLLSAAKLGALCVFLAVFVVAVNLTPAVIVPAIMVQGLREGEVLRHFAALTLAQAVAPALAGAWTVLAIVAVRGLLALLPGRLFARVSPLAQGVLILAFLAWAISLSPFLDAAPDAAARADPVARHLPPLWFFALYQWIVGNPQPWCATLARTALLATGAAALLVLAVFFIPHGANALSAAVPSRAGAVRAALARLRAAAGRLATPHPLGRASFNFTLVTLVRSAKHRLYLAGALGAGLAWAMTSLVFEVARTGRAALGTAIPSTAALQVQQVLVLFVVVALRFSVLVPAALPANWLFRVSERRPLRRYFVGARRAALLVALAPVAGLVPASVALWGWAAAGYHALVGLLFAVFLVELFFNGLAKVPFTAAYVSGKLKLKSRIGQYLIGAIVLTAAPSAMEGATFAGSLERGILPAVLLGLAILLAAARWRKERLLPGLVFEETEEEAIQTLRLSQ